MPQMLGAGRPAQAELRRPSVGSLSNTGGRHTGGTVPAQLHTLHLRIYHNPTWAEDHKTSVCREATRASLGRIRRRERWKESGVEVF